MYTIDAFHHVTFNSDLYLVAATVLPVLFIALMLESSGLARAAIWAARREAREYRRLRARISEVVEEAEVGGRRHVIVGGGLELGGLLALPAVACLLLFGAGEVCAVLALNAQHASDVEHDLVMAALVALPVALVAVAASAIVASAVRDLRAAEAAAPDDPDDPADPPRP
jgi:hypothetical protein